MTIFVCYWEDPHQGCGAPEAAFTSASAAREWCARTDTNADTYTALTLWDEPLERLAEGMP